MNGWTTLQGTAAPRSGGLRFIVLAPKGLDQTGIIRTAEKAGAIGVLAPGSKGGDELRRLIADLEGSGVGRFGVQADTALALEGLADAPVAGLSLVIAPARAIRAAPEATAILRAAGAEMLCEATAWTDDLAGVADLTDGYVLKGHECGGVVSEQTAFVLLQQFSAWTERPLILRGGFTPAVAAAARVGGAAGVVLDDQILLLAGSPLRDKAMRRRIRGFSGGESLQIEDPRGGQYLRGIEAAGGGSAERLAARLRENPDAIHDIADELSWAPGQIAPGGQGLALAAPLARRYKTLGRLIGAMRRAVEALPENAASRRALAEDSPLASALGMSYPIVQGPMTRVSDVSDFFLKVADGGALPVAALALMRGEEADRLLSETAGLLGDRPWGVGILGFADKDVLKPQFDAIERSRPDVAIVAGGRINQILDLEKKGIAAFAHVSTAGLVTHFLDEGARRFVIEGRECGGHIGPLSSFVLWGAVVEALRDHPVVAKQGKSIQLVFAGGIHDAVSAAMVATIAEPLAARGVSIGVLMGTSYLFTREIVDSGAILPDYQTVALDCRETQSLWEGPGFASRCAVTPITTEFRARKQELEAAGSSVSDVRKELETYSLGRLRMATKGLARSGPEGALAEIGEDQRRAQGMYMIGQVAALRGEVRSIAELHDDVSAGSVAVLEAAAAKTARAATTGPAPADIAIVGMATIMPGADTLAAYWRRVLSGESAIREVPADRWSLNGYFSEDRDARDKVYSRRGGFLDDVPFNPLDYGIPPASLPSIDPMQLLALELVSDAIDDAGIGADGDFDRSRVSVMFGFSGGLGELGSQYAARAELPRLIGEPAAAILDRLPEWTEDSFAGLLPNVAAGRVANRFDFGGTNQTVDAACASSLAAIYGAVLELESGRADMAVAGGIDSLQSPFGYLCFSKTKALSPRGVCNTFDASADGIVISEGLAAVVLKRLADAERDGDRIYAVIKGVGASSDGRAKGLTAPLPAGQKRALARAYAQAGFAPSTVAVFEAHGTGTVAGDKAELETVMSALEASGARPRSSAIGSVKTLVGHTKAAAGVAGLIKVALGLHHRVLPPHALVETPNPVLEDENSPLYLSQTPRPWVSAPGAPRRAGVSSFGFGGTNFHIALEEYSGADTAAVRADAGADLVPFCFAAESREDLGAQIAALSAKLSEGRFASARVMALAAADALKTGRFRLAFAAGSLEEAGRKLSEAADQIAAGTAAGSKAFHYSEAPRLLDGGKLAFVFPGQGSQYPGMLQQAALLCPQMLDRLDRAEAALAQAPSFRAKQRKLAGLIYPGDAFTPADRKRQMSELTSTEVAQPALGAVEGGLFAALADLGVAPDMVAGHSYGEFVALYAGGVIGFEDLMRLSEARGRAMIENGDPDRPGAMAAVTAGVEETTAALAHLEDVVVANLNSPRQTVIAGAERAVAKAVEAIAEAGLTANTVPVSQAFHSPLMHAARTQFDDALASVSWARPRLPVYSNTRGRRHGDDPDRIRETMAEHLVSPVDFVSMVEAMANDGAAVFLEVGPKSVLSSRIAEILGDDAAKAIALDRSSGDAASFLDGLARLFVEGCDVDLARLLHGMADVTPRVRSGDERHLWYLNGAYARPADAPKRDVAIPPQHPPRASQDGPAPTVFSPSATEELEFMEISKDLLNAAPPSGVGNPDMLAEYHSMMKEFLRVQESVMMAYLGSPAATARPAPAAVSSAAGAIAASLPALAPGPAPAPEPAPSQEAEVATAPEPAGAAAPPATPAPEKEASETIDLLGSFTAIVAERTGYPEDMLDPDQAMEADLGIDSIKRMEILGALQKTLPEAASEAMRAEMDIVTELATIREIVDFVASKIGDGAVPNGGDAAGEPRPFDLTGEASSEAAALPRFIQQPYREPADHIPARLPEGMRVLVTEAADGFHEFVEAAVAEAGGTPVLLPESVLGDPDPQVLRAWLAANNSVDCPLGLAYLGGRQSMPAIDDLTIGDWRRMHRDGTKRLFRLLQAAAPTLKEGGRLVAVTETGGVFGRSIEGGSGALLSSAAGGLGIVKALSLEWPGCSSKAVDLDPSQDDRARATQIIHELSFREGRREVGYPDGHRTILRTEPAALTPPETPSIEITEDWVVVATGGGRGITAECLRALAPQRPTLVLVGRSSVPDAEDDDTAGLDAAGLRQHYLDAARAGPDKPRPAAIEAMVGRHLADRELRRNLTDFEAMGAKVDYRAADVSDPNTVTRLFADLYDRYGRVDLVVHGAGLIEDGYLEKKTEESFDRVFDTKVDSAFLIAKALRPESLKGICFFTSVAGRYGNAGQTDYAAANETLNRLAWALKRRFGAGVAVKAINWGPWAATSTGAGMVTDAVRRQFEARGIEMVEPGPGRNLFARELLWGPPSDVETVAWVADGEHMEAAACALPDAPGAERLVGAFALLGNGQKRENGRREIVWRFDLVNAPYVDHHRFDGVAVMPVAAIMQMMSEVPAAFGITEPVVAIENLRMFKGLTLESGPADVQLRLEEIGADGRMQVTIQSEDDPKRVHYRGDLVLAPNLPESPSRIDALSPGRAWTGPDIEEIYRRWLSHGPRFQTIRGIFALDEVGLTAGVAPTRPGDFVSAAAGTGWSFDPGLIDGLLQTVWIWTRAIQDAATLPLSVSAVRRFSGNLQSGPLRAETRILSPVQDSAVETTLRVFDADGRLCYELESFKGQSSPQLNRLGGGWQGGERDHGGSSGVKL